MQLMTIGGTYPDFGTQGKRSMNELLSVQGPIQEKVVCTEL